MRFLQVSFLIILLISTVFADDVVDIPHSTAADDGILQCYQFNKDEPKIQDCKDGNVCVRGKFSGDWVGYCGKCSNSLPMEHCDECSTDLCNKAFKDVLNIGLVTGVVVGFTYWRFL